MGTDHDLRADLAAWMTRMGQLVNAIDGRIRDIEARLDDLEALTDPRPEPEA